MTEPTPEFQEPQMPNEGEQPAGTVDEAKELDYPDHRVVDQGTDTEQEADAQAAEARSTSDDERQY